MRCGCFGLPHCGQRLTRGASMRCVARRLSRRAFDVFFFGTAMSRGIVANIPPSPSGSSHDGSLDRTPGLVPAIPGGPRMRGTVSATHITKSLGGDVVLDDVSLVVPPRARIGVVGPNGAGKSTLVRGLAGQRKTRCGR